MNYPSIIAIDFTPEFVNYLRNKYQKTQQVQVIQSESLSFLTNNEPDSIAGCIDSFSLIHMPDEQIDEAFFHIYRCLHSQGVFVMGCWQGQEKKMEAEPYQIQNDDR